MSRTALQHFEPGWRGLTGDTKQRVVTVTCDKIPPAYRAVHRAKLYPSGGLGPPENETYWCVGERYGSGPWVFHDNTTRYLPRTGGAVYGNAHQTTQIPEEYYMEDENEFGTVSP